MKIKINATELKEILDTHFGGVDTVYELELLESLYAMETRIGKEKMSGMESGPNLPKVVIRGIFPNMSVLLSVLNDN